MEPAEVQRWSIATKSKRCLWYRFEEIDKNCRQKLFLLTSSADPEAPKGRLLFSSESSLLYYKEIWVCFWIKMQDKAIPVDFNKTKLLLKRVSHYRVWRHLIHRSRSTSCVCLRKKIHVTDKGEMMCRWVSDLQYKGGHIRAVDVIVISWLLINTF